MAQALYSFADRAAADRFAERVRQAVAATADVDVHVDKASAAAEPHANTVDELVSGGLVTSVWDLLQGVFDWPESEDRQAWTEQARLGGAVVSVRTDDGDAQRPIDALAADVGCVRRTGWRAASQGRGSSPTAA
jgi:hypothetical protein